MNRVGNHCPKTLITWSEQKFSPKSLSINIDWYKKIIINNVNIS